MRRPKPAAPKHSHTGPAHGDPVDRIDATKDIAAPDPARAGNARKRGRIPPQIMDYSVSMTIPEGLPVRETELRALEILLGSDLKALLAGKLSNP